MPGEGTGTRKAKSFCSNLRAGIQRIFLNGSFVTDIVELNEGMIEVVL
jgi:hypothetical protein